MPPGCWLPSIRGLPNRYETSAQILSAIVLNDRLGRPDDYVSKLPALYRSFDASALDAAARTYLGSDDLVFVVVGDRKVIDPQLKGLGLPIEYAPLTRVSVATETPLRTISRRRERCALPALTIA